MIGHGDPIAFYLENILHSENPDLNIFRLKEKGFYPEKASGWRLAFNQESNLVESEPIRAEEKINTEREY